MKPAKSSTNEKKVYFRTVRRVSTTPIQQTWGTEVHINYDLSDVKEHVAVIPTLADSLYHPWRLIVGGLSLVPTLAFPVMFLVWGQSKWDIWLFTMSFAILFAVMGYCWADLKNWEVREAARRDRGGKMNNYDIIMEENWDSFVSGLRQRSSSF